MMFLRPVSSLCCLLLLVGCEKKETPEYRLTTEQLAWQPYRTGDVLRFGQIHTSKVRTFRIEEVNDRIQEHCNSCGGVINLFPGGSSKLQEIRVDIRRTDTVRYVRTFSNTSSTPDSVPLTSASTLVELRMNDDHGSSTAVVQAQLGWDFNFYSYLPVQEVVTGLAMPDTTARLLPSLQVGGVTYGPVIQLSNARAANSLSPRVKAARRVYYAKGVGVVAFIEGNTLWYKLP